MADDYITSGEFGRFRADFNTRICELGDRMEGRFDTIDSKFDHLNGRTRNQAEAIIALDARIKGISEKGCGKYEEHRIAIEGLPAPSKGWQNWHPATKAGASVGGMAVFAAILEIIRRLMEHFGV